MFKNSSNLSGITIDTSSQVWCMLKLNQIVYKNKILNLVSIGFGNGQIYLVSLLKMEVHQILNNSNEVYSLAQFKDNSNYLICSLSDGELIIYKLKGDKYEHFQTLKKPINMDRGEINKVITLSDGNLATAERGAISFWKPIIEKELKKFEFFKEIITEDDTCQLLEVNPQIISCAIYKSKLINVYKRKDNNDEYYSLYGQITDAESTGESSNSMAKINEKIFCSGGERFIYIVSVEPVQIIQKILMHKEYQKDIQLLHKSNDGFIFTSSDQKIIQFLINKDEEGNYICMKKFYEIETGECNRAIATIDKGKIFYKKNIKYLYGKSIFILDEYKIYKKNDFRMKLSKFINF